MPLQDNFAEQFIRGHALGTAQKRQREEMDMQKEEREWNRKIQKIELQREELADKLKERFLARQEALSNHQLLSGVSEGNVPQGTMMKLPEQGAQPGSNNPLFGNIPGGPQPSMGAITPSSAYARNPNMHIPSLMEGQPGIDLPVDTPYQANQKAIAASMLKASEHAPTVIGKEAEGVVFGGDRFITRLPKEPGQVKDEVKNEWDFAYKHPEEYRSALKAKAQLERTYGKPEHMNEAELKLHLFKTMSKEDFATLYGHAGRAGKSPADRLSDFAKLAGKLYPDEPEKQAQFADGMMEASRAADSGADVSVTDIMAKKFPNDQGADAVNKLKGGGGMWNSILSGLGGLIPEAAPPTAAAAPPSAMPPPVPKTTFTAEEARAELKRRKKLK